MEGGRGRGEGKERKMKVGRITKKVKGKEEEGGRVGGERKGDSQCTITHTCNGNKHTNHTGAQQYGQYHTHQITLRTQIVLEYRGWDCYWSPR